MPLRRLEPVIEDLRQFVADKEASAFKYNLVVGIELLDTPANSPEQC